MTEGFPKELTALEIYNPLLSIESLRNEEDAKAFSDARQDIKDRLKKIESIRKHLKEPSLEACRRIDEQAKEASAPLLQVVGVIDQRLLTWTQEQEAVRLEAEKARRAEEMARLEAEASAAALDGDEKAEAEIEKNLTRLEVKPIEVNRSIKTAAATTYVHETWKFAISDASLIPREYLIPDEVAIGKIVRAMKERTNIPGIKAYAEKGIGGRR